MISEYDWLIIYNHYIHDYTFGKFSNNNTSKENEQNSRI